MFNSLRIRSFVGKQASRQTEAFVYSKNRIFRKKSGFSENFMSENLWNLAYDGSVCGRITTVLPQMPAISDQC